MQPARGNRDPGANLIIEGIGGADRLEELRVAWRALARKTAPGNVFLTPTWVGAWLRSFPDDYESSLVLVGRRGTEPRALAPLVVCRESRFGLPGTVLRFPGGVQSSYKGFLIDDDARSFLDGVLSHVDDCGVRWDMFHLDGVPREVAWREEFLSAAHRAGLHPVEERDSTTPFIRLPTSYDEFRAGMKKSLRRNINRRTRQIEAAGRLVFERHRGDALDARQLQRAAAVEGRSWKAEREIGIFRDRRGMTFHTRLLEDASREFTPELVFLTLDGRDVAFQYGFVHDGCYSAYNTSFDREFHPFSPGVLVIDHVIRELIAEGVPKCDLLVGGDAYKMDFTRNSSETVRLLAFNRSPRGLALRLLHRLKSIVKRAVRRESPP